MINKTTKFSSFSVIFLGLFSKKKQEIFSSCFYRVVETLVKVWENSKKLWPVARVPTAFLRSLPNSTCVSTTGKHAKSYMA